MRTFRRWVHFIAPEDTSIFSTFNDHPEFSIQFLVGKSLVQRFPSWAINYPQSATLSMATLRSRKFNRSWFCAALLKAIEFAKANLPIAFCVSYSSLVRRNCQGTSGKSKSRLCVAPEKEDHCWTTLTTEVFNLEKFRKELSSREFHSRQNSSHAFLFYLQPFRRYAW